MAFPPELFESHARKRWKDYINLIDSGSSTFSAPDGAKFLKTKEQNQL